MGSVWNMCNLRHPGEEALLHVRNVNMKFQEFGPVI